MIVINIYDHSAVVAVIFMESFAALSYCRVCIGKCVDFTVEEDAFLDFVRQMFVFVTTYMVGKEITQSYFLIIKREIDMR